jgi:opacity protein-like surface antigen
MKRFLLVALALVFVAGAVQAADVVTTAGSKALVFQFNGLSNLGLGTYNGGIGMRYYLKDKLALRPGLELGLSQDKTKAGISGYSDDKVTDMGFGLSLALEKHMTPVQSISPYIGAGAGFNISNNKHEYSVSSNPTTGTTLKVTDKGMGFGVFGLAGFEWGFTNSVTLGGEYRLGLNIGSGKTETERQGQATVTSNDSSSFGVGFGVASLYISVNI